MNRTLFVALWGLTIVAFSWSDSVPFHRGFNATEWFQSPGAGQIPFAKMSRTDFDQIRTMGGDGIRLPVNVAAYAGPAPDYRLDPRFLTLFDQALDMITAAGLAVVIDNHSDFVGPLQSDRDRFLQAIWTQFAQRYKDRPTTVLFEIQNEPHDIGDGDWAASQLKALAAIRAVDPARTVVLTGARWGGIDGLLQLKPVSDPHVVYSFHFYEPMVFTHQGADWAGEKEIKDVPYPPNPSAHPTTGNAPSWLARDLQTYMKGKGAADLAERLDLAVNWARKNNVSLWCGEMGVYRTYADPDARISWYRDVRNLLEERKIPWTAWDYHSTFGIFLRDTPELFDSDVNVPMVQALGLTPPPQGPEHPLVVTATMPLYDDGWAAGTRESGWTNGGSADFYDLRDPHSGKASLTIEHWKRYASVAWDLAPVWDLSPVRDHASLSVWMRSNSPQFQIDLRFVDGPGGDGLPWRLSSTIDQKLVPGDGAWHHVEIPLSTMTVTGAWDGKVWHPGKSDSFSWDRVAKLEFAAESSDLTKVVLGIDDLTLNVSP